MKNFDIDNRTGQNHEGPNVNTPLKYLTATTIIGDKVMNLKEEKLGSIKDVMINLEQGTIEYVVIEMGGFLGIGEKFFAIPFSLLRVDTDNHAFILNQDKDTLKDAPGFDKDHWPQTNEHFYSSNTYWGGFMGPHTGAEPF